MVSRDLEEFYFNLSLPELPEGVGLLNPMEDEVVQNLMKSFFNRFYNDDRTRIPLFGINPGRFGAGITGINFTDPVHLADACGIENSFPRKLESSSKFIYTMIEALGGVDFFYGHFLLAAVSPLGFISEGKNLNYYDRKDLEMILEPFILKTVTRQNEICGSPGIAFSIGRGKNQKFLEKLNKRYSLFTKIIPLPHPRWVMQYRYKQRADFIEEYRSQLMDALDS